MLALPAQQIDLWCCRYAQIDDAGLLSRYRSLLTPADYVIAVCTDAGDGDAPQLVIRQAVPLRSVRPMHCTLLAQT